MFCLDTGIASCRGEILNSIQVSSLVLHNWFLEVNILPAALYSLTILILQCPDSFSAPHPHLHIVLLSSIMLQITPLGEAFFHVWIPRNGPQGRKYLDFITQKTMRICHRARENLLQPHPPVLGLLVKFFSLLTGLIGMILIFCVMGCLPGMVGYWLYSLWGTVSSCLFPTCLLEFKTVKVCFITFSVTSHD